MYANVCFPFFSNQTFTYYVPKQIENQITLGSFVKVKFKNKISKGLVTSLSFQTSFLGKINKILSINAQNYIPKDLWETLEWMEYYYITPIGKVVQVSLSWLFKKNIQEPKKIKHVKLNLRATQFNNQKIFLTKFTVNQQIFIKYLLKNHPNYTPLIDLKSQLNSVYSIYQQLQKKNMLFEKLKNQNKGVENFKISQTNQPSLTVVQNNIYKQMHLNFNKNFKPHFLHGITGSGKTEIYLKLTFDFFSKKKSCLILVPEIVLSTQIYNRFKNYFGDNVLFWHNQAHDSYKREAWNKMNTKKPYIIVGARSALFTPLHNLGLIIIDEEHSLSYKESERQPCYNARDMGIVRGKLSKSMVVLGSATPSVETYYNAIINKYHLYQINERYGDAILPTVKLINMNNIRNSFINKPILSKYLINRINQTLNKNEQVLILHNRRGFSSLKICNTSDKILKCQKCDIILTFHQNTNQLICHYCNTHYSFSTITKESGNQNITYLGYGTEQLEFILKKQFPNANILRMDADSANSMNKQEKILFKFKKGECNILLGTQMIAKGLDFDNVTLVAIVNADLGMLIPDFKAHEKMFQLIQQVIGRSGRRNKKGEAIIQTYKPENNIIQMATNYHSKKFYNLQLESREALNYPPFIRLIRIVFESKNIKICQKNAEKIFQELNIKFKNFLVGPLPCPIEKLSNNMRYHILIKIPHSKLNSVLQKINAIQARKKSLISKAVKMLIDVDANSVL